MAAGKNADCAPEPKTSPWPSRSAPPHTWLKPNSTQAASTGSALRDLLHHRLDELLPGRVQLNGRRDQRLPKHLNISITGVIADQLLAAIPGIAAATGAGLPFRGAGSLTHTAGHGTRPWALSALRLTLGRWTTRDDIEQAARQIAAEALAAHPIAML